MPKLKDKLKFIREVKPEEKLFCYAEQLVCELPFTTFSIQPVNLPIKPDLLRPRRKNILVDCGQNQPYIVNIETKAVGVDTKTLNDLALRSVERAFQTKLSHVNVNIRAEADCFFLCENTETYVQALNVEYRPGSFGYMLISLPTENGPSEAVATVTYKTEMKTHQLKPNSLMIVAGLRCTRGRHELQVKPAGGGQCAFLVFHLVWADAFRLDSFMKPDAFPMFVEAASRVQEALKVWIQPPESSEVALSSSFTRQSSSNSSNSTFSVEDPPKFLCIPLLNDYSPYDLKMENLKGIDAFTSQVLESIDYLDVQLAVLRCPREGFRCLKNDYEGCYVPEKRVSRKTVKELNVIWSSCGHSVNPVSLEKHLVWSINHKLALLTRSCPSILSRPTSFEGYSESDSDCDVPVQPAKTKTKSSNKKRRAPAKVRRISSDESSDYDNYSSESDSNSSISVGQCRKQTIQVPKSYSALSDVSTEECISDFSVSSHGGEMPKRTTLHAVLLIKPKWNTASAIDIEIAMGDLRNRLTNTMGRMAAGLLSENDSFISDFERFVSHVYDTNTELDEKTCIELITIATRLHRVGAGVKILNFMAINKYHSCNADTASHLTDFVIMAGWKSCSNAVLTMSTVYPAEYALLGKRLFYSRCFEGAARLVDAIIVNVSTGGNHASDKLRLMAVLSEVVCLLRAKEGNNVRYELLLNCLKELDMSTLKRALARARKHSMETESLTRLFNDVMVKLAGINPDKMRISTFVSIVKERVLNRSEEVIRAIDSLMNRIFDEAETKQANTLLHRLIINHVLNDEDLSLILQIMAHYPRTSKALDSVFETFANNYFDLQDRQLRFNNLKSYLLFLSLAENFKELQSETRPGLVVNFMSKLKSLRLIVIVGSFQYAANDGREITSGQEQFYASILELVIKNSINSWFDRFFGVDELLECILWFEDKTKLVLSFIFKLIHEPDDSEVRPHHLECFHRLFLRENLVEQVKFPCLLHSLLKKWANVASKSSPEVQSQQVPRIFVAYIAHGAASDTGFSTLMGQMIPQVDSCALKNLIIKTMHLIKQRSKDTAHLGLFKNMCIELSKREQFSEICLEKQGRHLEDWVACFIWLGDENLIGELFRVITSITPDSKLHNIKLRILKSDEVAEHAKSSEFTRKLFRGIIDDYINKMNDMLPGLQSWALSDAVVPRDPEMQNFMRSEDQVIKFINYKTKQGAKGFGKRITTLNPNWGLQYSLRKSLCPILYQCVITKTHMFPADEPLIQTVSDEIAQLVNVKNDLFCSSGEPPSKRSKV